MPNWCNNEITVSGDEDKVKEFKEYVVGEWYHGACGRRDVWTPNKDATEPPWGEYKSNPDFCGGEEFLDTCEKIRNAFSFHSIIPMPKEIEHTSSPAKIFDTQKEVDEYIKGRLDKTSSLIIKHDVSGTMTKEYSQHLKNTYGADNWYDWSVNTWGTKWDTSEAWVQDDGWSLQYDFDTAWSPPEGIHAFLVDKFPDLNISWFYREDGMEMAGYL